MRKLFLAVIGVALAAAVSLVPFLGDGERQGEAVVGILLYTNATLTTFEGFKAGLAEAGLREGRGLRLIYFGPAGNQEELDAHLRDILAEKPALIFASPTPAALAAKRATAMRDTAVVFAPSHDPVALGLVANPARPEGNITGVSLTQDDDVRLALLREVAPKATLVFVPYNPADPSSLLTLSRLRGAKERLGFTLVARPLLPRTDILGEPDFLPPGTDAVFLPRDSVVESRIAEFAALCLKHRLPLSVPRLDQLAKGGLIGYGFNDYEVGRMAARQAARILGGAAVGDVPVVTAPDEPFVNLDVARRIGVVIPESVLTRTRYVLH